MPAPAVGRGSTPRPASGRGSIVGPLVAAAVVVVLTVVGFAGFEMYQASQPTAAPDAMQVGPGRHPFPTEAAPADATPPRDAVTHAWVTVRPNPYPAREPDRHPYGHR